MRELRVRNGQRPRERIFKDDIFTPCFPLDLLSLLFLCSQSAVAGQATKRLMYPKYITHCQSRLTAFAVFLPAETHPGPDRE